MHYQSSLKRFFSGGPWPATPARTKGQAGIDCEQRTPGRRRTGTGVLLAIAALPIGLGPGPIGIAPALAQSQPQALAATQRPYGLLKTGDRIQVTVVGFPDLSGEQPISADGTLQLPLVGSLYVAGLTPQQAVDVLTAALIPYVRRPQVGLVVVETRPLRISITGEVSKPGIYQISREELGGASFPTLSTALSLAGGITPNADLRRILIRRSPESGPSAPQAAGAPSADKAEININLWDAIQQGSLADDPMITDGDEIVVARAEALSPQQQQLFLRSTVAPTELAVSVAGEVRQPGHILVDPSGGVSAAVAAAGGPTTEANLNEIQLLRMDANGQMLRQTYHFGEDSGPLYQGDVILVGRNTTSAVGGVFNFLGTLLNPFSALSNIFNNNN